MDEEIDTESNVHYNRVQIKSEPSVYNMSTVSIFTGTESCEQYPDTKCNQSSDGSGDYKCDIESHETAKTIQNMEVQIKEEPNTYDTCGHYSWNVTEARDQSSDHQSRSSGENDLHVHKGANCLDLNVTNYAVCIKYEPNSCEENGSLTKYGSSVNFGKQNDQANGKLNYYTPDNSHCYENCSHDSDDIFNGDVQISCRQIKCEKNESNIQKERTKQNVHCTNNRVHTYDDHNPTHIICYEENHDVNYSVNIAKRTHIERKQYTCDICSFSSVYSSSLAAHKRRHTGAKPYSCDVCNYNSTTKYQLARHKRIHTGEKPYKCDICSYSAISSSTLGLHKRKHTEEKLHKCDICSYSTNWSDQFVKHKTNHTSEIPYKCDISSYSTTRSNDLALHKIKHTEKKRFKCDVCSYSTFNSGHLKVHKQKHTGEKPYKCEFCSYRTAYSNGLSWHKRKHTKEKLYKCDLCSYSTFSSDSLAKHTRKHTREKLYTCIAVQVWCI